MLNITTYQNKNEKINLNRNIRKQKVCIFLDGKM